MKNLNQTIQTAVAQKIEELLKPIATPTSIWKAYYCTLEDLQSEFPLLDRWSLRIALAAEILDRGLVVAEELDKMKGIYYNAHEEMSKANEVSMRYTWAEDSDNTSRFKFKTPPEIIIDEKFEIVMKSVLRPFIYQKQKPLEVILERAERRSQSRMPIVRPEEIREFILEWGLAMGLFALEDIEKVKEMLEALKAERR